MRYQTAKQASKTAEINIFWRGGGEGINIIIIDKVLQIKLEKNQKLFS